MFRLHHLFCSCHAAVPTLALSICFLSLCVQATLGCKQVNHPSECAEGETFRNSSNCCEPCRSCDKSRMYTDRVCNLTHNTECACESPQVYKPSLHMCVINCLLCPVTKACIPGTLQCKCENDCYADHDEFCTGGPLKCISNEKDNERTTQDSVQRSNDTFFPEWGIGLVAIGVVIGIIIFASCFLCLGLITITKHREAESQTSESSENGLVVRSSFGSVGTESSLLSNGYPYLTSHCMLELLKQNSNPQLLTHAGSGNLGSISGGPTVSSSLRSSPVSVRDSPRPVRTIKLMKQSNKLSTVAL